MATIARRIMGKWNNQGEDGPRLPAGYFIKFKDGNTKNCYANNLEYISFIDTFNKPHHSQRVDWDGVLTRKEKRFVIENWDNWIKVYQDE